MDKKHFPPPSAASSAAATTTTSMAETATDFATMFNYPSLGQLFENPQSPALSEMRAKLTATYDQLERVVRRGSPQDAERATQIAAGFRVILDFLTQLEALGRKSG